MSLVGIAYKGGGHLVRVYSGSYPRQVYEEKDTLSANSLINFLLRISDGDDTVIPINGRQLASGYTPVNQAYYESKLQREFNSRGVKYRFLPKDPYLIEQETAARKRENKLGGLRKRRDRRLGK